MATTRDTDAGSDPARSGEKLPGLRLDAQLVAFLRSLTDARSRDLSALVPERVPSGLPIED